MGLPLIILPKPVPPVVVAQVFFYPQGKYFSSDSKKSVIIDESGQWVEHLLRELIASGDISDDARVEIPQFYDGPLCYIRERFSLGSAPVPTEAAKQIGRLKFTGKGVYECLDLTGQIIKSAYWFVPTLRDMVKRGVVNDATIVHVPNLFAGKLSDLKEQLDKG